MVDRQPRLVPRLNPVDPGFRGLLASQDFVVSRSQATHAGLTKNAIANRMTYDGWQTLLPNVFLAHPGEPSRRQLLVAALLWAGPRSAIDGRDACRFHGLTAAPPLDDIVHIVVPSSSGARDTGFVRVRRTSAQPRMIQTSMLRYVDPATAAIAASRSMTNRRAVLGVLS